MRHWVAMAGAGALAAAIALIAKPATSPGDETLIRTASAAPAKPRPNVASALAGIDLTRIRLTDKGATAPAAKGRVAHLSLDPDLQRAALRLLKKYKIPDSAIVLLDVKTGRVLVWASQSEGRAARDLCVEAKAPAASIFKVVTGSALVEEAGLGPQSKQCYSGGQSRLEARDLVDNPQRDKWCATLAEAMGRSLNAVFARLAIKHLSPDSVASTAKTYGFGEAIPFDVPVAKSQAKLPEDHLNFGRTAAGFWNTTLSPLAGATMMMTIANDGEMLRPVIVESVTERGVTIYEAPKRRVVRKVSRPETAQALTTMLEATVSGGTSHRAFRDNRGRPFLPNIRVAGKTGTLTDHREQWLYTWFTGFAPSRKPEVAIAVLAANRPVWHAKANVVARDMLRAYFAKQGAPGVTTP